MEKAKPVELSEEEQEVLRKFHEEKRKALLAQLNEHNSKIEKYGGASIASKGQTSLALNGFPHRGSKPAHVMFVINEFKRFAPFSEILSRVSDYVPALVNDKGKVGKEDYRNYYGAIFSKVKSEDLISIKNDDDLTLFGLPEWTDASGNPKEEYK